MPLSDREQKVLDDMERGLHATEPRLVVSLFEHHRQLSALRALALPGGGITVGLTLVLAGLVLNVLVVSVLGFLLIVWSIVHVASRRSTAEWISRIRTKRPTTANLSQ